MKYVNRDKKGTFGYLRSQAIFELIKTLILFAMAFGIYYIGLINLGTNKSLWSILAILAMLPACKSLVGAIMLFRFKSLDAKSYNKYETTLGGVSHLYENVLTTSQKSYYLPVIACENNTLIGYLQTKKSSDVKEITDHILNVLKNDGHSSVTVKIYSREEDFIKRAEKMRDNLSEDGRLASTSMIFNTIKSVSL